MAHSRRVRLTVLTVHVAGSSLWLGLLTAAVLTGPAVSLTQAVTVTAVVTGTSGVWLARGLWRFGWVRAKLALTVLVITLAGTVRVLHLPTRPASVSRWTGAAVLLTALVVAVIKPHRTRKATHDQQNRQVVPRTETDQSFIWWEGNQVMGTYALRVLDRAARTALQVFAGYLVAAHTIGGVDWRTAILAAALTIALALLQGLVDLPTITGIGVWGDILGRAIRTAAQVTLGSAGANVLLITDIPWTTVLSAAGLAALTSIVTSLAALPMGPTSVQGTPEVFGPSNTTVTPVAA